MVLSNKGKGTGAYTYTLDIAPLRSESPPQKRSGMARVLKGFHSFTGTPTRLSAIGMSHTCFCLPSRSWYSFYRSRRDGRLSRPWCKVAQAEIRTRNLPIANPTLYHTATSAPLCIRCSLMNTETKETITTHMELQHQTLCSSAASMFIKIERLAAANNHNNNPQVFTQSDMVDRIR